MLRDRYDAMNIFELIPTLSCAMEPVLTQLDHLLDADPLFQKVKADVAKRYPQTLVNGRPSTPVEVIQSRPSPQWPHSSAVHACGGDPAHDRGQAPG